MSSAKDNYIQCTEPNLPVIRISKNKVEIDYYGVSVSLAPFIYVTVQKGQQSLPFGPRPQKEVEQKLYFADIETIVKDSRNNLGYKRANLTPKEKESISKLDLKNDRARKHLLKTISRKANWFGEDEANTLEQTIIRYLNESSNPAPKNYVPNGENPNRAFLERQREQFLNELRGWLYKK